MTASWREDTRVTLQFKWCFIPLCLSYVSSTYTCISVCTDVMYHYWPYTQLWHTANGILQMTRGDRLCMKSGSLHLSLINTHYVVTLKSLDVSKTRAIHQPSFQGMFVLHCTSSYPAGSRYKYLFDALVTSLSHSH
jgi:hypothetical protein